MEWVRYSTGLIPFSLHLLEKFGHEEKGISLDDAKYLLKEYANYDNILKTDEADIKVLLERYYQFKIDMLNELKAVKSDRLMRENGLLASEPIDKTNYRLVTFPNYGSDWFHVDSRSHLSSSERTYQAARIQEAYSFIYGVSQTYTCGNLYGTWSSSTNAAHEGIDMNYGSSNVPIKWFGYGTSTVYSEEPGNGSLVISNLGKWFLYRHMNDTYYKTINSVIPRGAVVGTQGNKSYNGAGIHLHLAVMTTQTPSALFPYGNDVGTANALDSSNIYAAIAQAFNPI